MEIWGIQVFRVSPPDFGTNTAGGEIRFVASFRAPYKLSIATTPAKFGPTVPEKIENFRKAGGGQKFFRGAIADPHFAVAVAQK